MVTALPVEPNGDRTWVLQPTRSLSWHEAKLLLSVVAGGELVIGVFFWQMGLPLVLPFSGLEVVALAAAFYLVHHRGQRKEVVRLEGDALFVERGRSAVEESVQFNRFWVRVELKQHQYRNHPRRLLVGLHGQYLELGNFLVESERESFAKTLINALRKRG